MQQEFAVLVLNVFLYLCLKLPRNLDQCLLIIHNPIELNGYCYFCVSACATTVDKTAADLALAHGFLECAKFLTTIQHTQTMRQRGQSGSSVSDRHGLLSEDPAAQKQESETSRSISRKRRRPDDV